MLQKLLKNVARTRPVSGFGFVTPAEMNAQVSDAPLIAPRH